ncbi:MAG: hypothetical protein ACOCV1_06800 [Bacillota bacterium]
MSDIYELLIACPKCGKYRSLITSNLNKIRFSCFDCGFSTTRKLYSKGNVNFIIGKKYGYEMAHEAIRRLNMELS